MTCDLTEFSQGMILPTANRPEPPQPETKKNRVQASKTQVDFSETNTSKYSVSDPELGVTSLYAPTDKPRLHMLI